ncbi:MAG: hypothetical protein EPO46_08690 [Lysobacter sp.]|nr:MAG: hypothetical protein EPO46_08690 [Lysobacter sp.]
MHGLNVAPFQQPVPAMTFAHVAIGAVFFTITGIWVGALYGVLSNAFGARRAAHIDHRPLATLLLTAAGSAASQELTAANAVAADDGSVVFHVTGYADVAAVATTGDGSRLEGTLAPTCICRSAHDSCSRRSSKRPSTRMAGARRVSSTRQPAGCWATTPHWWPANS